MLNAALAKNLDGFGVTGSYLHFALAAAFVGSALLVLFVLWRQGRLDFDESPKLTMMDDDEG